MLILIRRSGGSTTNSPNRGETGRLLSLLFIGAKTRSKLTTYRGLCCQQYYLYNRGQQLILFILGGGLIVQNIGSEQTFVTSNRKDVQDLTVRSGFIRNKITNWHVSTEPSCLEQQQIRFDVKESTQ
ncbi:hypothetical protein JTB14_004810 [Gonioctena quinquepunctata]|nr:hypothetical protein JTB14_004810 [Gonioctena quinquepunctata]